VKVRQDDIHEAHVMMGWQGPPFGERDSCALEVAAVVLGHGDASRLAAGTRRRDQLVSDVHATCYTSRRASTFVLAAHTTGTLAGRAVDAMLDQVEHMAQVAIDAEEMARARSVLESDLVYRRETVQGQAHAFGYSLSLNGDLDGDRVYYEHLAKLTPRDVQRACKAHLDAGRAVVSMVLPSEKGADAHSRRVRTQVRRRLKAQVSRAARAAKQRPKRDRNGIWHVDLDSGVRIRLHVNSEVPMAAGWLVWPGGMRLETARDAGVSALAARLLTRGTEDRSGNTLAREIDGMAAVLEGFSGRNSLGLHFESLAADLPTVLSRAFECSLGAAFPQAEIDEERRVAIRELEALEDDLGQVALRAAMKKLYGSHPLSRPRRGLRSSLARITREYLRRLWRLSYPARRSTLAIAGDIDVDEVVAIVRSLVPSHPGRLPARLPRWPGPAPSAVQGPNRCFVRRNREQAHLVVAYQGLPLGDRRNPRLDVLMVVLGGQSGRLFGALREAEGLVYDVSASSVGAIDAGHVVVHASTSQEKLTRARAAVRAELRRVAREPVQGEELDRVKACLIGQHETGLQRRGRVASHLAFNETYGLGYGAHLRYAREVERVSAAQVRDLARSLLDPGREVVSIVAAKKPRSG
jgi:zinc protease